MESISKILKSILIASECKDLYECESSIKKARALIKTHGYEPQLVKRIVSLENKRKKLKKWIN